METKIINGRRVRDEILERVKSEIEKLSFTPKFCDVVVGDDPASLQYVRMKNKTAEVLGIVPVDARMSASCTTEELITKIEELNNIEYMAGIIVQLPLPEHIDRDRVLRVIDPNLDVDCINPENSKIFYQGGETYVFPTARAVFAVLENISFSVSKKKVTMIGRGELVGRPVSYFLEKLGAEVFIIDSTKKDVDQILKNSDLIISACGKRGIVTKENIKKGVVVIDAGASDADGSVVGDIDFESLLGITSFISPVPGGVGPVTVAMLFDNVLMSAKKMSR